MIEHVHDHEHGGLPRVHPETVVPRGGPVILDIGDDVGALILYVDDDKLGTEIHVRADGDPSSTTHTGVWERTMAGQAVIVAVFPELVQDHYGILAPDGGVLRRVGIQGGKISEVDLRPRVRFAV